MDMEALMGIIKRKLKCNGIKQQTVASELGMTNRMINAYLNCRQNPSIDTLFKLMKIAGLDIIVQDNTTKTLIMYNDMVID